MGELSISHFRDLHAREVQKLKTCCSKWEKISSDTSVPEEVCGEIRTTIGLARLLMAQKLKQFAGLVDDSEFKRSEKEITCIDLQGFWDMVYQEVEKINNCFANLEKCQSNDWKSEQESPAKTKVKISNLPKKAKPQVKSNPSTKLHILAARKRLVEAKNKLKIKNSANSDLIPVDIIEPPSKRDARSPRSVTKRSTKKEIIQSTQTNDKENVLSLEVVQSPKKKSTHGGRGKNNMAGNEKVSPGATAVRRRKNKSTRELAPLQCVTRSAARALLLKQNAS